VECKTDATIGFQCAELGDKANAKTIRYTKVAPNGDQMSQKDDFNRREFLTPAAVNPEVQITACAIRSRMERTVRRHYYGDRESMKFSNIAEANQYLTRDYRDGWKLTSA
jgi:hypothetical protein